MVAALSGTTAGKASPRAGSVNAISGPDVLALVDAVAGERVLLVGTPPPEGRDFDLFATDADLATIARRLIDEGFTQSAHQLARFSACSVTVVDLIGSGRWQLPPAEIEALRSEATPLDGQRLLAVPAAHHSLLILAGKLRSGGRPEQKHRTRVHRLLAADPAAWDKAALRADAWRVGPELEQLRAYYEGHPVSRRKLRAFRPARTRMVSFSGVDGSGKSSQARALGEALDRLGYAAVLEWAPSRHIGLGLIARPLRRVLRQGRRSPADARVSPDYRPSGYPAAVVHVWATLFAVGTAASFWRVLIQHLGRGRVIVWDRYALDYVVFTRYRHGAALDLRFQTWLLGALAPRTLRSYLLDVAPEAALRRKEDLYALDELRTQSELYRSEASRHGVGRLDGERPRDELCACVGADVWAGLRRKRKG